LNSEALDHGAAGAEISFFSFILLQCHLIKTIVQGRWLYNLSSKLGHSFNNSTGLADAKGDFFFSNRVASHPG
jgi:hypothetical protein